MSGVATVTGASPGIGEAYAEQLAAASTARQRRLRQRTRTPGGGLPERPAPRALALSGHGGIGVR